MRSLGILAALTLAASATAKPVLLRYKPHPEARRYEMRIEETSRIRGTGGDRESKFWSESVVEKRSILTAPGKLGTITEVKSVTVGMGKQPGVKVKRSEARPGLASMSTRGEILAGGPRRSPGQDIHPVFPERPVEPGFQWSETLPGTKNFSLEVTVDHTFEAVKVVDGVRSAVIKSNARAKGIDGASKALVAVRTTSTLVLGLADGEVVRQVSRGQVSRHHPAPLPDGSQVVKKKVKKTLSRLPRE